MRLSRTNDSVLGAILCGWILIGSSGAAETGTNQATTLQGTWHVDFERTETAGLRPKLRLKQEGARVMGSSVYRSGSDAGVTNGTLDGNRFQFEVFRERDGALVKTHYTGTVVGDSMSGTAESVWDGGTMRVPFKAKRFSGIEGGWRWKTVFGRGRGGGRTNEVRLEIKREGEKLTGSIPGFGGRPTEIQKGTFRDGLVSFEATRGQGERRTTQQFKGKLEGDTIHGTIETVTEDDVSSVEWNARRDD